MSLGKSAVQERARHTHEGSDAGVGPSSGSAEWGERRGVERGGWRVASEEDLRKDSPPQLRAPVLGKSRSFASNGQ